MAAEQGNADGQNILGAMYETGVGVEKNLDEAIRWYRMASAQGNGFAAKSLKRLGQ